MPIVWSKQHKSVLDKLNTNGRYVAKKEFINIELEEHADLVLEVYNWLVKKFEKFTERPKDAEYPVWISYSHEATMLPDNKTVILELSIEDKLIMPVNISKWGMILNYSYIPKDEEDRKRHLELLKEYNTSDSQAYISRFHPLIKREIIESWDRLFDDSIIIDNHNKYGVVWELKKEWLRNIVNLT